ncbi:NEL-type E3 ubiquitin ligase domain-containing protein [Bradyrhizobium sp. ORS 285]|uniref:NEL-type E3 ubiquitin ligase domain-containing protein n=1 Tax=Bradyrhizobium sp. ORS 285 TaxID=115808 RepID=UPI00155F5A8A|nr:NEL-type E3 ubiquitin ligase domain-containing protein [Bradyrhizobium sp. ORS 285]
MNPFETGQVQPGAGIPPESSGQEGGQNGAAAQWNAVVTGHANCAPSADAGANNEALEDWAAEPEAGILEDRDEAVRRVNALGENVWLNLESLFLTSLPRLPSAIVQLDVPFNRLTTLPDSLPASLMRLDVRGNQLTTLPALPTELTFLDLNHNELQELPELLPASLQYLRVSDNQLANLPEALPTTLEFLNASGNQLTRLPQHLPATLSVLDVRGNQLTTLPVLPTELRFLDASSNRLRSLPAVIPAELEFLDLHHNELQELPEVLPASLETLNVSHNQLTNLPEVLPTMLEFLYASENQLTRLPQQLPASLVRLDVGQNQLSSLPDDLLTQFSDNDSVILDDNPLPEQVLRDLQAALQAEGYGGPTVYYSYNDESELSGTDDEQEYDFIETVSNWLRGNQQEGDEEVLTAWKDVAEEPGAQEYALFLGRLFDSVNAENEEFRLSVANDLRQAAKDPELRTRYFELALDANESCEDRRTLTWNGMQTARLIADVKNGVYKSNDRFPDLVELGRVMFRLDALERIARDKVHSLGSVDSVQDIDAIEVFLAYQNRLRERLGLQHVAPNMRFFAVSGVTDADVDSAEATVRDREVAEFADYLALDWQPWDDVVSHIAPEDHAMAQNQLIAAMETEFDNRLQQQLADQGLTGAEADLVEDAKRELGPAIRKEIAREIKGALRDKVLNEHGLTL